jgi:hypothetical protein
MLRFLDKLLLFILYRLDVFKSLPIALSGLYEFALILLFNVPGLVLILGLSRIKIESLYSDELFDLSGNEFPIGSLMLRSDPYEFADELNDVLFPELAFGLSP